MTLLAISLEWGFRGIVPRAPSSSRSAPAGEAAPPAVSEELMETAPASFADEKEAALIFKTARGGFM
jgi:hypothetical protein